MCLPRDLENKYGIGTNNLIKKGAKLVTNAQDILNEFKEFRNNKIRERKIERRVEQKYEDIYKFIHNNPITANELSKLTKKSIAEIEMALTILELDEFIENIPNKGVIRR